MSTIESTLKVTSADPTKRFGSDCAFVTNVHARLVRDFPVTPYQQWCEWVHGTSLSVFEKRDRILQWDLNPAEYSNPTLFAADYQLRAFLSKFSSDEDSSGEIGEAVAYRKFLDTELRCSAVNDLLMSRIRPSGLNQLLELAKKIIADVVGDVSDMFTYLGGALERDVSGLSITSLVIAKRKGQLRSLPKDMKFGPGVSVSKSGSALATAIEKLELATVTPNCWTFLRPVMQELDAVRPDLVKGSVLTFVPKKVGEMRAICYEPSMNMLVQKAIGSYLKRRLKATLGINLRNQQRNQNLARLGSLCDSWATIDLSSASDLNAYVLVQECLPRRWFSLLDSVRSRAYRDPLSGEYVPFEKFSTMGNGFTFELETLIFAAISIAAIKLWGDPQFSRRNICCYGDDICVPKEHYLVVCQGLTVIGHLPNLLKSFSAGPFRESCGGDYFNGWDVTPIKLKELRLEDPKTVIELHNRLFAYAGHLPNPSLIGDRFGSAIQYVRAWLERNYPRVSGGNVELVYSKSKDETSPVSSNQWIWGSKRNQRRNYLGAMVPRWLCVEVRDVVCEYHVPPTSVGWLIELGQGPSVLTEVSIAFSQNPDLLTTDQLLRNMRRKPLSKRTKSQTTNRE